jgi:hypothetical protein
MEVHGFRETGAMRYAEMVVKLVSISVMTAISTVEMVAALHVQLNSVGIVSLVHLQGHPTAGDLNLESPMLPSLLTIQSLA